MRSADRPIAALVAALRVCNRLLTEHGARRPHPLAHNSALPLLPRMLARCARARRAFSSRLPLCYRCRRRSPRARPHPAAIAARAGLPELAIVVEASTAASDAAAIELSKRRAATVKHAIVSQLRAQLGEDGRSGGPSRFESSIVTRAYGGRGPGKGPDTRIKVSAHSSLAPMPPNPCRQTHAAKLQDSTPPSSPAPVAPPRTHRPPPPLNSASAPRAPAARRSG